MNLKKCLIVSILVLSGGNVLAAPVNINSADAQTIAAALSGIGEKKADAIVKYRQEHGPFKSPDELVNINGIGDKLLAKIKPQVLVNEPSTAMDTAAPGLPGQPAAPAKK